MKNFVPKDLRKIEFDIRVVVPTRCLMAWLAGSLELRSYFKGIFQSSKKGENETAEGVECADTRIACLGGTFVQESNHIRMNIILVFSITCQKLFP